jgi:hypothetical protein
MNKTLIRARIKDDFLNIIDDYFDEKENHRIDQEFLSLCDRIAGKEVDLILLDGDAFEKNDDNYWIPECCYEVMPE